MTARAPARDLVLAILRSGRRCVACGTPAERADHVKPRHAGGPNVPENLVSLCDTCNRIKSCMWPGHGYHPLPGYDDPAEARRILARELEYLEALYGASRLLEAIGDDVPPACAVDLAENERSETASGQFLHLARALAAEIGDRAFDCWWRAGQPAWWTDETEIEYELTEEPGR